VDLLPPPKKITRLPDFCASRKIKKIFAPTGRSEPDAYRLSITPGGVTIEAADEAGLFYAARTLDQIKRQFPSALPCMDILDWPDYPVRGFYHDVTRGKVPRLKTLLALAETCASYKLNHLELYIEHTYAFKSYPEVWQGSDPLTADEILALDARCAELRIDLVPSFSAFGHFYTWIHHKFPELNELDRNVSQEPFCWWDRMMHYTLDCRNPRSIALVREIIREVRPLFRSRFFNICADETFDLGMGRNKALAEKLGKGRLYVDFLKQILSAVKHAGAVPLFWGDIIGKYPELVKEIPPEAIALDWDYSAGLNHAKARVMMESNRKFYVCPGVSGWNNWLPNQDVAHRNITRFARMGLRSGAAGLLNTDWGDYGHINTLGPTLPGIVLGACSSWNAGSGALSMKKFEPAVSRMTLGDRSGKLAGLLREAASAGRAKWTKVCWIFQPRSVDFDGWFDAAGFPNDMLKHPASVHFTALAKLKTLTTRIERVLARCEPADPLLTEEIRVGLLGMTAMEEFHLHCCRLAGKTKRAIPRPGITASHLLDLDRRLEAVWLKRNKPSEYFRIREVLSAAVDFCTKPGRGK